MSVLSWEIKKKLARIVGATVCAVICVSPTLAAPDDPFPDRSPLTRGQAVEFLAEATGQGPSLNSRIDELSRRAGAEGADPTTLRALTQLLQRPALPSERVWNAPDGTPIHYTLAEGALDRIPAADLDHDGVPDRLLEVARGLSEARALLVDRLEFTAPQGFEIVMADLGGRVDGYLIPGQGRDSRTTAVLEAAPIAGAMDSRHAAVRQYAHAVARNLGPQLRVGWSEALAQWSVLTIDDRLDADSKALLSRRLARVDAGLFAADSDLAAGNAILLSFIHEAYGPAALRLTLEELARGIPGATAMDRALRRAASKSLVSAFREFDVWSILTGSRADGFHFSFADELSDPSFASTNTGLPALSVHADPAVAPWGAAHVLIQPEAGDGGLRVRFEGEFTARWEADLLVIGRDGTLRRLAFELSEGRGELTLPLGNVLETILSVRNIGTDDGLARRYTYAAHRERAYPFELTSLDAVIDDFGQGVAISWETVTEQDLVGFNILRVREDGGHEVAVSPVWVPAMGNSNDATGYFFLDQTAESGVSYLYRIQGITNRGLTSSSAAVSVRPSLRRP
jgi:hypothetical protein